MNITERENNMQLQKIHEDKRGEIYSLTGSPLNYPEVSFLTCKAGFSRGGCIHSEHSEHLVVIEGVINYYYDTDLKHITLHTGQAFTIEPNTPHFIVALKDSIIAEWGCNTEEKAGKYAPFRKLVEDINNNK